MRFGTPTATRWGLASAALLAVFQVAGSANAQSIIKQVGNHANYGVEVEPHFALGFAGGPKFGHGNGFGPGVRFSIPIVENGFVKTINNSVAISFGLDWIYYGQGFGGGSYSEFVLPATMQWNFWVTDNWSFFGEPGVAIDVRFNRDVRLFPAGYGGARWHASDNVNVVFRIGYPSTSVGISFFL